MKNKKHLKVGDKVWVVTKNSPMRAELREIRAYIDGSSFFMTNGSCLPTRMLHLTEREAILDYIEREIGHLNDKKGRIDLKIDVLLKQKEKELNKNQ